MVPTGAVISDRFEIDRLAGKGGMGLVYRAIDRTTGRPVALKLLGGGLRHAVRFEREAAILADLRHPAIVAFVAFGATADGVPYLAMEWVDGPTLDERLAQGRLGVAGAVALATRLADALGAAHRRGVVHRDLKPSNVLLEGGAIERCKLLDFGVARWLEEGRSLTMTGDIVGTPAYMSPEQCRGATALTPASDVFSLGSLIHECLTGDSPFGAPRLHAAMAKVLFDAPPPLRARCQEAPASLEALLGRMMAKEPEARPPDGGAVAAALRSLDDEVVDLPPPPPRIGEKRLVSVVLAYMPESSTLPTMVGVAGGDVSLHQIAAEASTHGATLERLRDGSLVAVLRGDGDAKELCVRAARLALRLLRLAPGAAVAVATRRSTVVGPRPLGEVLEAAERLATAGCIRLDDVTSSLLETRFDVRDGVLHAERSDTEIRPLRGRRLPCVGRDPELAALVAAFQQCAGDPVARAFLVTAQPGVGKSRLAAELVRRLEASGAPAEVWTGQGDPMLAGAPYGILVRATRRLIAAPPDEPVPFPDPRPLLGGEEHALVADRIGASWCEWLAARCRLRPVLLVLEDLHWGDLPTIRAIDLALRELREQPFMVLALARPEIREQFPGMWASHGVSEIRLSTLSKRAAAALVEAALGSGATPSVVGRLVAVADGNAFYLEELIRAVHAGAPATLPESILAMVQARIDPLPDRARRLLRAASVLGETFTARAVAALLPELPAAELAGALEALVAQEILHRRGEAYTFRHALIHECVYTSLPEGDRRHAHRLAGELLSEHGGEPVTVAEHFERGGEPVRAMVHFQRAAEQALHAADFADALRRAGQGIECGAGGETLGVLLGIQAHALTWAGEDDAAARRFAEQALELLPADSPARYGVMDMVVVLELRAGATLRVAAILDELLAHPADPPAARAQMRVVLSAVAVLLLSGLRQLAQPALDRIDELMARLPEGDTGILARRRELDAFVALHDGDHPAALRCYEEAIALFRQIGDQASVRCDQQNLGFALAELGDLDAAEMMLRVLLADPRRPGSVDPAARQNLGLVLARQGRLDEARALLEESLARFAGSGDTHGAALSRIYLARVELRRGELEAAVDLAARAVDESAEIPALQPLALTELARCRLAEGRLAEALEASRRALLLARADGGLAEGEALVRLTHAEALAASGREEEARQALAEGRAWLEARAARIADARLRKGFLENIEEHRRLMAG